MMFKTTLAIVLLAAALGGCGAPAYQHQNAVGSALLKLDGHDKNWICAGGTPNRLYPDAAGYARIPVGKRLTFWLQHTDRRGRCIASVSFVPVADAKYRIGIEDKENQCPITVMREDPSARLGLSLELSADRPPSDCPGPQ